MRVLQGVVSPFLLLIVLGLGVSAFEVPSEATGTARAATASSLSSPPDTLRASAKPDVPLILALPSLVGDEPVERYTLLRGPALSGAAGRSFTWIPRNADPGQYEALLEAHHQNVRSDTLVVRITLAS